MKKLYGIFAVIVAIVQACPETGFCFLVSRVRTRQSSTRTESSGRNLTSHRRSRKRSREDINRRIALERMRHEDLRRRGLVPHRHISHEQAMRDMRRARELEGRGLLR